MKTLVSIFVLLFSFEVYADSGDWYDCESTNYITIVDGKFIKYNNIKFKFLRGKYWLKFGSETKFYLSDEKMTISSQDEEVFTAEIYNIGVLKYRNGLFLYTGVTSDSVDQHITSISARCSIL